MSVTLIGVLGAIALILAVLFLSRRRFASRSRGHGDAGAYTSSIIYSDDGSSCAPGDAGSCDGGGGGGGGD